jgi:subtilase family serine protease
MGLGFRWVSFALVALIFGGISARAEEALPGRPLLSAAVDDARTLPLEGNTRPEARVAAHDRQAVSDSLLLEHIHLQLKRSPAQERAVEAYVGSLTDRGSPNYHHWLSAAEFGKRFGVADADIARITSWLKSKNLKVNSVYPNRMLIDFSGTAGQVSRAFQTPIHQLDVNGVSHIANMSDPRIPAALSPAVEGIVSLHDFRAHNMMKRRPAVTGGNCGGVPCYVVGAADLATIYDLNDLFNASTPITGEGVTIATVEDTNLYSNADWTKFRQVFGLSIYTSGNLQVMHPAPSGGSACHNPGVNDDDGEAALDVEWASAAAPGASILLASCAGTATTDGVYLATQNLVNSAAPPAIISVSYGICEVDNGATSNASFNKLYQQAAAEGISVFVATGDNGPTDCSGSVSGATVGIGINGWGSSQYNVAIGGTDFRDVYDGNYSLYWKANSGTSPWSTAKSYIAEVPWNDTCANQMIASFYGPPTQTYGAGSFCNSSAGSSFRLLGGGEGGPSGCYTGKPSPPDSEVVSGTCKGYPKPGFQRGLLGVPTDGVRDVPDISLFASDGSAWGHNLATCFTDPGNGGVSCAGNPVNWANAGGTSYATPIMAGIQALVDQYTGTAQGNPLPTYYALAKAQYGASGDATCSANKGRNISTNCIFRDIVSGDVVQDCKGTVNCYRPGGTFGVLSTSSSSYLPAYKAKTGFDLATGIGSVDGFNLVANWPM